MVGTRPRGGCFDDDIDTTRLGGQTVRRKEGFPDAAVVGVRRWALRAGLVIAAGAAGLAMSAGSAQADTGLGGTLDHVVGTVPKAAGGSHGGAKAAKPSKPQASKHTTASPGRSQARRSPVATVVRSTTRTVVRPVVKPVVTKVVRPVVKPVVRTATTKPAKPVTHRQDPPRHAAKPSAKPVTKPATRPAARPGTKPLTSPAHTPLVAAERALVDLRVELPAVTVPTVSVAGLEVAVQVPRSVDLTVAPDLSGRVDVGASGPLVAVQLPGLPGVQLPGVQVPGIDLPGVDLPGVGVPGVLVPAPVHASPAATTAAPAVDPTAVTADLGRVVAGAPVSVLRAATSPATPGDAPAAVRTSSVDEHPASATSGLPGLPGHPAPDLDLSSAPSGAATGGAANGALLLGVAVAAALTVDRTAVARALAALVTEASRLVRQPGFAPD